MKASEITVTDLADYLRLDDPTETELLELERMLQSAVAYASGYTGLDAEGLDAHPDVTQAVFVLVADMFDNRNYQTEKEPHANRMVDATLALHSVNLV